MMLRCPLTVVVAIPGKTQAFDVYTHIYIYTHDMAYNSFVRSWESWNLGMFKLFDCGFSELSLGKFKKLRVVHVYRFFSLGGIILYDFQKHTVRTRSTMSVVKSMSWRLIVANQPPSGSHRCFCWYPKNGSILVPQKMEFQWQKLSNICGPKVAAFWPIPIESVICCLSCFLPQIFLVLNHTLQWIQKVDLLLFGWLQPSWIHHSRGH